MNRAAVSIPEKLFFKIGEVCDITGIQAHVLRYWESEFPMLAPQKNRAGQRTYRKRDVEMVLRIKELLYEDQYTIAGARRSSDERAARREQAQGRHARDGRAGSPHSTQQSYAPDAETTDEMSDADARPARISRPASNRARLRRRARAVRRHGRATRRRAPPQGADARTPRAPRIERPPGARAAQVSRLIFTLITTPSRFDRSDFFRRYY